MKISIIFILLNICIYIGMSIHIYKKCRYFSSSLFIALFYLLCAISSILFFIHPYTKLTDYYHAQNLSAFVYFGIITYILLIPIIKFDTNNTSYIRLANEKYVLYFLKFIFCVQLLLYIGSFSFFINMLYSDMGEMRNAIGGGEISPLKSLPKIISQILFRYSFLQYVALPIAMYAFFVIKTHRKFIIISTISTIIFPIYNSILYMMRSQVFLTIIFLIVFLIIFRKRITQKTKKRILIVGGSFVIALAFLLIAISNSRFQELASWMYYKYAGETFINFAGPLWNDLKENTEGLAYFRWILTGTDWSGGLFDKWSFIESKTGINSRIFYGSIGQLIMEFGKIQTFCIYVILSYLICKCLKKDKMITLPNLIIIGFLSQMLLYGVYIYPFQNTGIIQIFLYCIFYYFFKIKEKKHLININA